MRRVTTETTVYAFDELTEGAKATALDAVREIESTSWEHYVVYWDAARVGTILGFDLMHRRYTTKAGETRYGEAIFFTGFYSQGDGACFEKATYAYSKGASRRIREYAPEDTELHRIADCLQALQARYFYGLTMTAKHRGHYVHSGCMDIDVSHPANAERLGLYEWNPKDEDYEAMQQLCRDFADWVYALLREDYEYRVSDESVLASIESNAYEFDEDGHLV